MARKVFRNKSVVMEKLRILSHSTELFADQREAGRFLASQLTHYRFKEPDNPKVASLPLSASSLP